MGNPMARACWRTRASSARRARHSEQGPSAFGVSRFAIRRSTRKPDCRSAETPSSVSCNASSSGSITQWNCALAERRSACRERASSCNSSISASSASRRTLPRSDRASARCLACRSSRTCASLASVAGMARRRRVCPVGAVSTTTSSKPRESRRSSVSPTSSSTPGSESRKRESMSSSSRYVPREAMTRSDRSRAPSQRESARSASICAANNFPLTGRGEAESRASSASLSECAGSVETSSVRFPSRASARATAAAQVVFPAPPLPA